MGGVGGSFDVKFFPALHRAHIDGLFNMHRVARYKKRAKRAVNIEIKTKLRILTLYIGLTTHTDPLP